MNTTEYRLAASAAVASLLTALTLTPLLKGLGWFVAVTVTVTVLTFVGAAARRWLRWWPGVVVLQVLAATLTLTQLFARQGAVAGFLPGPATWSIVGDLLNAGLTATREEAPPVPSSLGLMLVVTGGVSTAALLVDLVAVSLRKPAAAGLPLLAVYCVPAAVLPGGLSWLWFVLGAAGFLLLVGADSTDRVQAWGRVLIAGRDAADDVRTLGGPLAGARRLAVCCLVTAVVVPAAVPGLGEQLLGSKGDVPGKGGGGSITVINPILRIGEDLKQRNDVVVLRYRTTATAPEPLRIVSDDSFDGTKWEPSKGKIPRSNRVQNGLPAAPGLTDMAPKQPLRTVIRTLDLNQTYLPLPYPTTKVQIEGPWLFDDRTLNVVGDQVRTRNLQYVADHLAVQPSPEQLRQAPAPSSGMLERYGTLPKNTPNEIFTTANRIAGNGTNYEKAVNLQQWFRNDGGFVYSEDVLPPKGKDASSQDAVSAFLRNKQGYCVQFASSMAVLARALDIPSRVGVGFLPGTKQRNGEWEISVRDAHAWPELYFEGIGWVRFEPTPSTRAGQVPQWSLPPTEAETEAQSSSTAHASVPVPSAAPHAHQTEPQPQPDTEQPPLLERVLDAVPWRVLGVIALLLALGALPLGLARLVRARRWRRATRSPSAGRVEAAWDDLRERLEDLGVTWAASWTPRALQLRLADDHELVGSERVALGRLVTDVEQVRYAPPGAPVRAVRELRADVELVVAGVTRSAAVPAWARHRARWVPLSGWRALTGAARRVGVATDEAGRRAGALSTSVRRLAERVDR